MGRRWFLSGACGAVAVLVGCGGGGPDAPLERVLAPTTTTAPPTTTAPTVTTTAPPVPVALAPVLAGQAPVAAGDPAGLADQIVTSERVVRDPASAPELIDAAGRVGQVAYRRLSDVPEWDGAVLALVPAELLPAATNNINARREFRAMHTRLSDTLPAWRIVEPVSADELLGYYREAEARFGVTWNVLAAVNLVETGMGRIVGLSTSGAQGPMQFMPATWGAYGLGGDVNSPRDAILGAANYLAANGAAAGQVENALFHYNRDRHYVTGVLNYASVLQGDPRTFYGFHAWEVIYTSVAGDIVLPVGYEAATPIPVTDWLASHPPS